MSPVNLGSCYSWWCRHKAGAITGHTGSLVEPGPETSPPTVSGPAVSQSPSVCSLPCRRWKGCCNRSFLRWLPLPGHSPELCHCREDTRELAHMETCTCMHSDVHRVWVSTCLIMGRATEHPGQQNSQTILLFSSGRCLQGSSQRSVPIQFLQPALQRMPVMLPLPLIWFLMPAQRAAAANLGRCQLLKVWL